MPLLEDKGTHGGIFEDFGTHRVNRVLVLRRQGPHTSRSKHVERSAALFSVRDLRFRTDDQLREILLELCGLTEIAGKRTDLDAGVHDLLDQDACSIVRENVDLGFARAGVRHDDVAVPFCERRPRGKEAVARQKLAIRPVPLQRKALTKGAPPAAVVIAEAGTQLCGEQAPGTGGTVLLQGLGVNIRDRLGLQRVPAKLHKTRQAKLHLVVTLLDCHVGVDERREHQEHALMPDEHFCGCRKGS
mmetsp:Transcript_113158/g.292698  ORF Transcript_113158/g.292698 Transcript_113158/m.292698 type:complete len:245 (+) Transcript_113158:838-1572(+)